MDLGITLSPKRKGAGGRRRIMMPRIDRKIRDICIQDRKLPVRLLTKNIRDDAILISQRTVQWRLAENKLIARKPARKPKLTPAMIKKRLDWARKYKNFTIQDREKVCFSDESVFQVLIEKIDVCTAQTRQELQTRLHRSHC